MNHLMYSATVNEYNLNYNNHIEVKFEIEYVRMIQLIQ